MRTDRVAFKATKHVSDSIGISNGSPKAAFSLLFQLHLRHLSVKMIFWWHPKLRQGWTHPTGLPDWSSGNPVQSEHPRAQCSKDREKKASSTLITLCDSPVDSISISWASSSPSSIHLEGHLTTALPWLNPSSPPPSFSRLLPLPNMRSSFALLRNLSATSCHQSRIWTPKVCRWYCHQSLPALTHTLWDNPFRRSIRFKNFHKNNFTSAAAATKKKAM